MNAVIVLVLFLLVAFIVLSPWIAVVRIRETVARLQEWQRLHEAEHQHSE